jgi:hypothetical protein
MSRGCSALLLLLAPDAYTAFGVTFDVVCAAVLARYLFCVATRDGGSKRTAHGG